MPPPANRHCQPYRLVFKASPCSQVPLLLQEGSQHNSDAAEEDSWPPEQRVMPQSPLAANVGLECAAAVNLMSMRMREEKPLRRVRSADCTPQVGR